MYSVSAPHKWRIPQWKDNYFCSIDGPIEHNQDVKQRYVKVIEAHDSSFVNVSAKEHMNSNH